MKYNKESFTFGAEIEWGDIDRTLEIPEHLGTWEFSETDIVNFHEPYKYQACDPLGIEPPMGGEVNTKPTNTKEEQVQRIMEIHKLFTDHGNIPTTSSLTHSHIHIRVPGLIDDIEGLKKLTKYIQANQELVTEKVYQFVEPDDMRTSKGAKMYHKWDGGRLMPDYMVDNIMNHADDFKSFITMQCAGKDHTTRGRPFRYAINTYCLKHTQTIEFRCFRGTLDPKIMLDQFRFVEMFIDAALNDGPSVQEILDNNDFTFPPFIWDKEVYDAWLSTKWDKERGKKARNFYEVA